MYCDGWYCARDFEKSFFAVTLLVIDEEFNLKQYSSAGSVINKMTKSVAQDRKIRMRVTTMDKIIAKSQT